MIMAIWCMGIASKGLAAYRIASKGLFHRLPIFWAYILISVARSIALLCFVHNPRAYAAIAADSMPMMLLSEGFAIASVFWVVTENFPRWRKPGTVSLSALAMIGTSVALLTRAGAVPKDWGYGWAQLWESAVLVQRHGMVVMAVVLAGIRFLLTLVRMVPVRPVARRAADVLFIDVALGMSGSLVTMWFGKRYPIVAFAWPVLAGLTNGLLWAFWLPAASDGREIDRLRWRRDEEAIDWRGCFVDLFERIRMQFSMRSDRA